MYIEKRRRRWYAVYDIPEDVRVIFGKSRFVQSLKTESKTEAERLVLTVVADWQAQIDKARDADPVEQEIMYLRSVLQSESSTSEHGEESNRDILLEDLRGRAEKLDLKSKGKGVDFYQRAIGKKVGTKEHLKQWSSGLKNAPKTIDMKIATINKLSATFPTLQDITRRKVQLWAQEQVTDNKLSPKTVKRDLSFCKQYWAYLQNLDVVEEDQLPFDKVMVSENTNESMRAKRKAFRPEDIIKLREAAKKRNDQQLCDLIQLAMWTGARIEELCSLKTKDVSERSFKVVDAKTQSGWREVPLHSQLKETMKRLLKNSTDGYVLSSLSKDNKYDKRSNALGKRFGRLKDDLGFEKGTEVFHSIRKTVLTLLKDAGVPEVTAADIVGHSKPTLTYGLYPGDPNFEVVRKAVEKLKYR